MIAKAKYWQKTCVLCAVALLSACGGEARKPDIVTTANKPAVRDISHTKNGKDATNNKDNKANTSATAKPAVNSGGYYKDDGPGENAPNIDAIPNAIPKVEAPITRANKPYSALGLSYTPMTQYSPYKARGTASWYGKRYHGQKTASGEVYDMYAMTAAHTILPLTSYARVSNPENGKSVIVRVNDRGPFHSDRLIDLSYAAAYKLGLLAKGSGIVDVEAIDSRVSATQQLQAASTPTASTPVSILAPVTTTTAATAAPVVIIQSPATTEKTIEKTSATTPSAGIYLQAGAFKSRDNADKLSQKITQQNVGLNVAMQTWYNAGTYRVWFGPFANKQEALAAAQKLKPVTGNYPIVITQP